MFKFKSEIGKKIIAFGVSTVMLCSTFLGMNSLVADAAISGLPGEFGNSVGDVTIDGITYENYERGYAYDDAEGNHHFMALRNKNADGTDVFVSDDKITDLIGFNSDNPAEEAGAKQDAERNGAYFDKEETTAKMKEKAVALAKEGISVGVRRSFIKDWNGLIVMEFSWGDGAKPHDWSGGIPCNMLIYNPVKEEAYLLPGDYMLLWIQDYFVAWYNKIGMPVSDIQKNVTVTLADGTSKTFTELMLFENGYIYKDGDTYGINGNAVYDDKNNKFITSFRTDFPLVCGEFNVELLYYASFTIGSITYENHLRGYIAYDSSKGELSTANCKYVGGKNMLPNGEETPIRPFFVSGLDAPWPVGAFKDDQADSTNAVKPIIENNYKQVFDKAAISDSFIKKYEEITKTGYNPGMCRSYVKTWDALGRKNDNEYEYERFYCSDGQSHRRISGISTLLFHFRCFGPAGQADQGRRRYGTD